MIIFLFLLNLARADELGLRYNNLGNFEFSGGKIMQIKFDHNLNRNIYLEGALGPYYYSDFDTLSGFTQELSPGLQISSGSIRAKLSQGLAYISGASIPTMEFVTHLSLLLVDNESGASLGLERTHYSNGQSNNSNLGLDMTGLVMDFKL